MVDTNLMPGVTYKLLPENTIQDKIEPTQVILHTAVDAPGATNLPGYFGRDDIKLESHFWITTKGKIVQMIAGNVRADANRWANSRAISIETEDDGKTQPWNQAQLDAIHQVVSWACETYDIPRQRCTGWKAPGIGWHSMWGWKDPINLKGNLGANPWTPSSGKTCPGKPRIAQVVDVVIPRLQDEAKEAPTVTRDEALAIVAQYYRYLLMREPDIGGLNYWADLMVEQGVDVIRDEFRDAAIHELAVAQRG